MSRMEPQQNAGSDVIYAEFIDRGLSEDDRSYANMDEDSVGAMRARTERLIAEADAMYTADDFGTINRPYPKAMLIGAAGGLIAAALIMGVAMVLPMADLFGS
ncbi:MAG: hypothetical protein AAGK23_08065 [Pseudomonadota bacterium]